MTDGHFVPSDTGSKPVVDIVFSNVMHDWVGSNRIVINYINELKEAA